MPDAHLEDNEQREENQRALAELGVAGSAPRHETEPRSYFDASYSHSLFAHVADAATT